MPCNWPRHSPYTHAQSEAAFWSYTKTDENGCLVWTGAQTGTGYGAFRYQGKVEKAHRVAWVLKSGFFPKKPLMVRHTCDNRLCVNQDHLLIGTHADNMADAMKRNRMSRGERHVWAILTESDVRSIRSANEPAATLAVRFGVARSTIYNVRCRKNGKWKHVT